jgi:Raf kinase inhibitor-like YbhB/YbcL family protein
MVPFHFWRDTMKTTHLTAFALAISMTAAHADAFRLSSPDIADGKTLSDKQVLKGFGCEGGNQSPALRWSNAPDGTKSFVLTAYDPDAPTGSGWWHWVVFNIPADARGLEAGAGSGGALPAGAVQGRTDFGAPGYGGACPPPGTPHRYIFKVTALKVDKLDLDANASAALVGFMTNMNSLGSATITAQFGR